jgi:hypothetical protein
MKKVFAIAILSLSLTSCEEKEVAKPNICLKCVADSWEDTSEYPLAGFPNYGTDKTGLTFDWCDQPADSRNVTKSKFDVRHIYINNVGYKITRRQFYTCNPK